MDRKPIKLVLGLAVFSLLYSVFNRSASAGWHCEPQYGGGEKCWGTGEITVDKMVTKPDSSTWVDNLYYGDPRFSPGDFVFYKLRITNNGQGNFNQVNVWDIFPSYLDFYSGPSGWDGNVRELRFHLDNLNVGETREILFTARIVGSDRMSASESVICNGNLLNRVKVETEGKWSEDTAQICVEKKATSEVKMPPTGASLWLMTITLIGTGLAGLKLALAKRFVA